MTIQKKLPDNYLDDKSQVYKRDKKIVDKALMIAGFTCEGDCKNILFKRKDGRTDYTEGHHLIPLRYQRNFIYSLDVEANVVSLCPHCHRKLHYGIEVGELLETLYEKRIGRLERCGIAVSYEELLLMYR